ncbi:TonB-dependent receptor [Pseudochryseolinea flava]|uniref:TonB-dependent receptor n=1 Tax=Pseudochryseolinea flava TaxID=2059302 RepID=A0A364Y506_9BACT|nr:TonB-dependent receptor [Pseudochryseolinea flava]RAW02078.1 TonB-dependent receptor [Pseudochryseolinea flava]
MNPFPSRRALLASCVFVCLSVVYTFAQTGSVSGVIKDANGEALSGISVVLLGTSHGTATDANGAYSISNIPAGAYTLKSTAVGFQSQTQRVTVPDGGDVSVNIGLSTESTELSEVTITSTGIKDEIKDIPGTVNIIDATQIRESGAQSVGQIITRIPGVNYLDEDGRGLKPNIGLRGLDPLRNRNLLVLVDGKFPIGMTLYGDPAAYYMVPLQQVERIEVIKGASPVLYGGYSVGGVVNMISKRGSREPQTTVDLSYGSWRGATAQVTTGADNGKFNYFLSGLRRQGDGYRDRADYEVNDYTIRLGGKLDETTELSLYLNLFSEDSQTPGGLTQAQYDQNPKQSQHTSDEFFAQRFSTALSFKKTIGQYQTISTSLYGNYFQRDWWISYATPKANGFLRDIHALGNVTDYNLTRPIAGHNNSLIAGVRIHTDRLDDINVAGADKEARTGPTTGNKINTSFIHEFYLYDEFDIIPSLTFAPGVRYTSVKYKRDDLMYKAPNSAIFEGRQDEITSDAFVYSAGLIYKIKDHSRVYTTFSRGFQPPALNSALAPGTVDAGVDLQPETSKNLEVGIRTNPVQWLQFNISAYGMVFDNKVIAESGVNKNAGSSLHRGIEAELELGSWKGISLFANITKQRATFTSGENDGNILPNAPTDLAAAGIRYKLLFNEDKLVFNLSYNYVGKQYSDAANTEVASEDGKLGPVPSYNVTNFTINYNRKHWGVYFNVNNVFDEKYFTLRWATWNGIIPSPDRNFLAGVNFKF